MTCTQRVWPHVTGWVLQSSKHAFRIGSPDKMDLTSYFCQLVATSRPGAPGVPCHDGNPSPHSANQPKQYREMEIGTLAVRPASLAAVMKGADTLAIATASAPVCSGGIFPFKKCTFHKGGPAEACIRVLLFFVLLFFFQRAFFRIQSAEEYFVN